MPIKKGNTTIGAIYKGTTQIAKVYKGTTLLFENAVWLDYYFSNLYHSLVPQTISSKSVKNKAKVAKIYANGVVENQLVTNGNFESTYGISVEEPSYESFSVANNTLTFTLTNNIGSGVNSAVAVQTIKTHKYLLVCKLINDGTSSQIYLGINGTDYITENLTANQTKISASILTASIDNTKTYIRLNGAYSSGKSFSMQELQVIDLTLRYGTGNEPTALTDNRIQALLNRDYTPYNAGTYKGTDIGEFSSEPYNLFDEQLEAGNISSGNPVSGNEQFRTKNFTPVVGGQSYTFEYDRDTLSGYQYIYQYDENKNLVIDSSAISSGAYALTLDQRTRYVKIKWYKGSSNWGTTNTPTQDVAKVCIHRTGTRTGYAPHQTFTPISFIYQGNGALNAHDTMEITKDNVVFTKNVGSYTFTGSESWTTWTNGRYYTGVIASSVKIPTSTGVISNAAFGSYLSIKQYDLVNYDKTFAIGESNGNLIIRDTTISNVATSLTGWTVYYELATPQTITIPRKYMGVVDLGSLTWVHVTGSNSRFTADISGIKTVSQGTDIANIFCSQYITDSVSHIYSHTVNGSIGVHNNFQQVWIYDGSKESMTTDQFKAAMSGIYLFYETSAETTDIADTLDIEAGGTITTDSEVLPNVDMKIKCK